MQAVDSHGTRHHCGSSTSSTTSTRYARHPTNRGKFPGSHARGQPADPQRRSPKRASRAIVNAAIVDVGARRRNPDVASTLGVPLGPNDADGALVFYAAPAVVYGWATMTGCTSLVPLVRIVRLN